MADISKITLLDGSEYNLKDTAARESIPKTYAGSVAAGGSATVTNGIHYAQVDGSSTATVFTASINGITEYYDGLTVLLKNGVITSASGFTVNINGLGAKPVYSNMAAATRETTIFNVNYTLLLIYDSTRVTGGCWINYRGYYSDANSTGYQLRTDSTVLKTLDPSRYYRLMFTSADRTHWVPANTAKDNSATSQKIVNQRPIDPFGRIIYFGYTTNLSAESDVPDNYCWDQHTVTLGYSFNTSGAALELTTKTPVYIKCAPQSDGSAIIDSTTPYVQALPSTDDGMIYIYLGVAYNATNIELVSSHPVYYYKDGAIRLWTGEAGSSGATAMTDQEIEDAFTAGWKYKIAVASGSYILSVSCDGSHGVGAGIITESVGNSTITVEMTGSNSGLMVTKMDDGAVVSTTSLGNGVFSFTMPFGGVLLSLGINSGGSND